MIVTEFSGERLIDLSKAKIKELSYAEGYFWMAEVRGGVIHDWKRTRAITFKYDFCGKEIRAHLGYFDASENCIENMEGAYLRGDDVYVLPYSPWNDVSDWLVNEGPKTRHTGWRLVLSKKDCERLYKKYKNGCSIRPGFYR